MGEGLSTHTARSATSVLSEERQRQSEGMEVRDGKYKRREV